MKEITDVDPSVLVIIVKANGDEEVAFEAFRNGSHDYLKKLGRKNILPDPNAPALPAPATVTLSQYHKIQQAVRFINDKYRTDVRLDATAREAGMSPSHFSRTFKKVMGLSYQVYLNNLRITEAKNLLHTSPRSLTEIAVSLGFSDLTGFGRIFKKLTGHTPSAYRNLPRSNFLPKKA